MTCSVFNALDMIRKNNMTKEKKKKTKKENKKNKHYRCAITSTASALVVASIVSLTCVDAQPTEEKQHACHTHRNT
jgi:hypothetical protein